MKTKQVTCTVTLDRDLKVFLKVQTAIAGGSMGGQINAMLREWKEKVEAKNVQPSR